MRGAARRRGTAVAFVLLASVVVPLGAARAAACPDGRSAEGGPLPGGTEAADFGAIPEACAGSDLAVRLRGSALVAPDKPDFFGAVVATSTVRLRQRLGRSSSTWLSVAADLLTYRYVVNGPVASQAFSLGPPTLGVHRALGEGVRTATTVYGRVLLPLDTARQSGVGTGLELGATGRRRLGSTGRAGVQGGFAVIAPLLIIAGQSHATFQSAALLEGWFAPTNRFAVSAGVSARAEIAPDPTFLTLAPRVAARLATRHLLDVALLVESPVAGVAGVDRTDVVAALYVVWAAE